MVWQLQVAKQKFSELVRLALDAGPQVVSRHGEAVVVVLAMEEYRRLTQGDDLREFLLGGPDLDRLDIRRREKRFSPTVERLTGLLPSSVDTADYREHLRVKHGL